MRLTPRSPVFPSLGLYWGCSTSKKVILGNVPCLTVVLSLLTSDPDLPDNELTFTSFHYQTVGKSFCVLEVSPLVHQLSLCQFLEELFPHCYREFQQGIAWMPATPIIALHTNHCSPCTHFFIHLSFQSTIVLKLSLTARQFLLPTQFPVFLH